jgi:hypothetical protein
MGTERIGCGLPKCQCMVTATLEPQRGEAMPAFCSDYCRESDEAEEESMCACGHPACDTP